METIITQEAQKESTEAIQLAVRFENFSITAPEQYKLAADDLKAIKAKAKELDERRKSMTKPLDESKKSIMEFFSGPIERLAKAESAIKYAMVTWQQEQERIRQAEEARLREIQRQEQEKIRLEQERIRAEQERLRIEAEKAAQAGKQEDADAAAMEAEIVAEEAKTVEFQAIAVAAPIIVTPTVKKIEGIKTRKVWRYRIVDPLKVPREYLVIDEQKLGQYARAMKESAKVDGVEFYADDIIAAG